MGGDYHVVAAKHRHHFCTKNAAKPLKNGAPGAIRTPGPQIRSLMLYPAELRVHWSAAIRDGCKVVQDLI